MKKIIFIFLIISTLASDNIKEKLVSSIVKIFSPKKNISVFINDENYKTKAKNYNLSVTCKNADFYIIKNMDEISKNCFNETSYILVTNYQDYKKYKNVLGAIFWQKGRLNLIFKKRRLKELSISLPNQYDKYIE